MEAVFIDTSEDWVAIIIGQEAIVKILNSKIRKAFGKTIHMRELRLSKKFSALRIFKRLFSKKPIKLYSLKRRTNSWCAELVKELIKKRISTLYVDLEVYEELHRKVHSAYLKTLNIYASKEDAQCADILAYGDSHYKLVRNIWEDLSIRRGGS